MGGREGERAGTVLPTQTLGGWIKTTFGEKPVDLTAFERALTHGSQAAANYERLEFLGDRVLGLVIAEWLYERFGSEAEGALSRRLNALVTGAMCAGVAREVGVAPYLRLGKQARDDGAADSDNVLGDVMEALIGALYLQSGLAPVRAFIRKAWASRIEEHAQAPQHPKSALQEWAAANNRKPPEYEITDRSGPNHAPKFVVTVRIPKLAEASAPGTSKGAAETAAAAALLEKLRK
ncbi:ribonuclease III [Sphingomonas soli]|uniref:ribonuclease III n=1 Tax=Sphingomonas soli TaxID=266127 RepID=UPI00082C0B7D